MFIVTSVTALNALYQIETFCTSKIGCPDGAANSRRPASCRAPGFGSSVWISAWAATFCSGCSMTFLALASGRRRPRLAAERGDEDGLDRMEAVFGLVEHDAGGGLEDLVG